MSRASDFLACLDEISSTIEVDVRVKEKTSLKVVTLMLIRDIKAKLTPYVNRVEAILWDMGDFDAREHKKIAKVTASSLPGKWKVSSLSDTQGFGYYYAFQKVK